MPNRLVCSARGAVAWDAYVESPLKPDQVRVQNRFGAEKHGTMMAFYKGYANDRGRWDKEALMHRTGEGELWNYPIPLGNMQLGEVVEAGPEASFRVGDTVFFTGGFRPTSVVDPADCWKLPEGTHWKDAMMLDPSEFALGAIRDGSVRAGDRIAIFGMGAIGLATIQVARAAGVEFVVAIDPLPNRRAAARACGADAVLDPSGSDIGLQLRDLTGNLGVDVAIDFSGSPHALQASLRGVGYLATIVCGAFPPPFTATLDFGGEAHMNRPKIVFTRACSDPNPDGPRWSHRRIQEACYHLIASGKIKGEHVIDPIVPFENLLDEYPKIASNPQDNIKLAVTY